MWRPNPSSGTSTAASVRRICRMGITKHSARLCWLCSSTPCYGGNMGFDRGPLTCSVSYAGPPSVSEMRM